MDTSEQFAQWQAQADQTMADFANDKPKKAKPQPRTSFFDDTPSVADYEEGDFDENDPEAWNAIYRRAMEVDMSQEDDDGVLNEENQGDDFHHNPKDGFGGQVRGDKQITKGDITYNQNPIDTHSVGRDQGGEEGDGIRVTKNFSQGPEIEQVDELGRKIEMLERKAHKLDVESKVGERDKLYKELKSLRSELRRLSEKMQPPVDTDVT